jgi:hypothetical protein
MTMELDHIVLLAPVLALAVVALVGFAGCGFEGALGPPSLQIRGRVPTALTVTQIVLGWEAPSTPRDQVAPNDPSPAYVDGADNVFSHSVTLPLTGDGVPVSETWTVRCVVIVQGGATPAPSASGTFTLDGSLSFPTATFQAMGGATDLAITFVGVM